MGTSLSKGNEKANRPGKESVPLQLLSDVESEFRESKTTQQQC